MKTCDQSKLNARFPLQTSNILYLIYQTAKTISQNILGYQF